jgi:hypothetical protein
LVVNLKTAKSFQERKSTYLSMAKEAVLLGIEETLGDQDNLSLDSAALH